MIVVTGAAGFIGSCLVSHLNSIGKTDLIVVDEFSRPEKMKNLEGKKYIDKIDRDLFFDWFEGNSDSVDFVYHLGARTDTAEFDWNVFLKLNLGYSQRMWEMCSNYKIPLVYASSAATYGMGEHGYLDSHEIVESLEPLNPYGKSKNDFDAWVLNQEDKPPFWAGLKFFNVYGPNEFHKSRMASVIFHAFHQIRKTGGMKLFRSHREDYDDGMQMRDFVYVKDVVSVCAFLLNKPESGIYNLGTGKAESFLELARSVFVALDIPENISFVDTPKDIREKYQYFTEADMHKLIQSGYDKPFTGLREAADDYVKNYLLPGKYF